MNSLMFIGSALFLLPYISEVLVADVPNLYVIRNYLVGAATFDPQLNAVTYRVMSLCPSILLLYRIIKKKYNSIMSTLIK